MKEMDALVFAIPIRSELRDNNLSINRFMKLRLENYRILT
jgi:hypothetical protein